MSKSILNIYYRETLDKIDSYEAYLSSMSITLDTRLWKKSLSANNKSAYQEYLNEYPKGNYHDEAQLKINEFNAVNEREKETKAWNKALNQNTKSSYKKYLMNYYNGLYNNEAKRKVDEFIRLEKEKEFEEKRLRDIEIAKEKETWEIVCKEDKSWSYSNYMEEYPNGIYFNEALSLYEMLHIEITTKKYPNNRLFIFNINGKKGVINRDKEVIIDALYTNILTLGDRFISIIDAEKEGLIDIYGETILELGNYDLRVDRGAYKTDIIEQLNKNDDFQISAISYNKQWINHSNFMKMFDTSAIKIIDIKNDTFGYISNDDKLLLKPIYENIYLYKNGLGRIVKKGRKHGLCGLINNKFELLLECNYGYISSWKENSNCTVIRNKDWSKQGIVNIKGEIVIDFVFDSIEILDNSYFIAYKGNRPESLKYGLINPKGKIIIDVKYSRITYIKEEKIFLIEDNDKFGFANTKGEITVEPELDEIYSGYNFGSYGNKPSNTKHTYLFLTLVEVPIKIKKGNKYGLIDKHGKYLLTPKYNYITFEHYISKNIYLYMTSEDLNGYRKGFIIYNNGRIAIVFSKNIDITYINILNIDLIEFKDTKFGAGIATIDGKILLESSNPISYKLQKNKILKEYGNQ